METNAALEAFRSEAGAVAVRDMAARIARDAPSLENLSTEQLETLARVVIADRLRDELRELSDIARIDYKAERDVFLSHASRTASPHTAKAYTAALDKLEAFASFHGMPVLSIGPKEADDFCYAQGKPGRAAASVRLDISGCSAFFSFLERRHSSIRNPFRGTKARPAKQNKKPASFPTDVELRRILDALPGTIRAAASVMAYRGLRVGSLQSLSIVGKRFTARSKGKDTSGDFPAKITAAIRAEGLDPKRPFAEWTEAKIRDQFRYYTKKLAKSGVIAAAYSVHDLRHYFALSEYRKDKDMLRLRTRLGHSSIQITETYLRGLGEL